MKTHLSLDKLLFKSQSLKWQICKASWLAGKFTLSACPNSAEWCRTWLCFQKVPFTHSFHFSVDLLLEFITSISSLFRPSYASL